MKPNRTVAVLGLSAVVLVADGCKTAQLDPGFDELQTLVAVEPLSASDFYPLQSGQWTYAVTVGTGAGEPIVRLRGETERLSATWVDDEDDRRSEFWRLDERGNIVMPAVIEHQDRALTFFDPPLILAYHELPPGSVQHQEVAMRVVDLTDPTRFREFGTATRSVEYVGDALVRTPLGEFTTKRVVVTFEADLRFVDVTSGGTLYVVPGLGPIVVQREEHRRILGFVGGRTSQTLVLRSSTFPISTGDQPSP